MSFILIAVLVFSGTAYSKPVPVTYTINNEIVTVEGINYKNGYGYNLKAERVLRLVTLNWPPYIDDNLCNKGWVFQLTLALLLKRGYGVHIEFYPWARAIREAELGHADIVFPEYFIADEIISTNFPDKTRNSLLALSDPIPGGDLSLVTLNNNTITFDGSLSSVKDKLFGVARAYKNTEELDLMIERGEIKTIVANNESQLIKLLMSGRVDLIVIDPEVLKSNVRQSELSNTEKQNILRSVIALEPSLEYKDLYYQINKSTADWQTILYNVNTEVSNMRKNHYLENFIREKKQQCE